MKETKADNLRACRGRLWPAGFISKSWKLILGGGVVFWMVTIATSLLPIAAEYRAAFSNWRIQTVWADSLPAGMLISFFVSFSPPFHGKEPGKGSVL